jgi:hypothetical protein
MDNAKKSYYTLLTLSFFPCIGWGILNWIAEYVRRQLLGPVWLTYPGFRVAYLGKTAIFIPLLLWVYRRFFPDIYRHHSSSLVGCAVAAVLCLLSGLGIHATFENYLLDGGLVSPLLEECTARFPLYEARKRGLKTYIYVASLSSLSFGLMHFCYEPTYFLKNSLLASLRKLLDHVGWSYGLCALFWFRPNLPLLVVTHAASNLISILIFG